MQSNRLLKVNLSDIKSDYSSITRAIAKHNSCKVYNYSDLLSKLRGETFDIPVILEGAPVVPVQKTILMNNGLQLITKNISLGKSKKPVKK